MTLEEFIKELQAYPVQDRTVTVEDSLARQYNVDWVSHTMSTVVIVLKDR